MRGRDRSAAERAVRGAVASGRIIQADADLRLAAIKEARTVGDLELVTHDLAPGMGGQSGLDSARPPEARPPSTEARPPEAPAPPLPSPYGPPQTFPTLQQVRATRSSSGARAIGCVVVGVVLLVLLGVLGAVLSAVHVSGGSSSGSSVVEVRPHADVLTRRGMDDLLRQLAARTGSTTVFEAVLYPDYAVLQVPVREKGTAGRTLYWNGAWDDLGRTNDASAVRIDLLTVKPTTVLRVLHGVESRLRHVKTSYVVIRVPGNSDPAVFWAYATSPSGRSVYAAATASGKVTYRSSS